MYNPSTNDKVVCKVEGNTRLRLQFPWQPSTLSQFITSCIFKEVMLHDRCLRLFLPTPVAQYINLMVH